jgi:CheY-like chemotaxis protein
MTIEADIPPISGDPDRLRQVVLNLLSNAIKFNHPGGNVYVRLFMNGSKVALEVRDEGEGIEPEFLPHVFERFIQEDTGASRRYGGLGLGLSIARNIVDLHGGTIQVTSAGRGKGSTFMVILSVVPVKETGAPVQETQNNSKPQQQKILQNLKVLIVDDDPYSRQLVKKILRNNGAEVIDSSNASDAIIDVKKENPDIILSDIGMPDISGYDFIREVRTMEPALGHHIPSAALSAYVSREDRERALAAGFEVHLGKPIEPHELVSTVAKLAGRAEQLR